MSLATRVVGRVIGFVMPSPLGVTVGEVWGAIQRGDRRRQIVDLAQQRSGRAGIDLLYLGPEADLTNIPMQGPMVVLVDEGLCRTPDLEKAWSEVVRVAGGDLNNVFVITHSQPWSWYHRLAPGVRNKVVTAPPFGPLDARPYQDRSQVGTGARVR